MVSVNSSPSLNSTRPELRADLRSIRQTPSSDRSIVSDGLDFRIMILTRYGTPNDPRISIIAAYPKSR